MGGIGSGNYQRLRARKRYVEECFTLDSFDFARQFGCHQRRWLRYDLPWSEQNRFSVSVMPKPGGYVIWAMVLDQELDQPQMWKMLFQIPSETRKIIFADGPPYWSQGQSFPLQLPLRQIGLFAPQFISFQDTQSSSGASCHWFLCPWLRKSSKTGLGEKQGQNSEGKADGLSSLRNSSLEVCSLRCRKLYWHHGRFACRQCHRLGYQSQGRFRIRHVQEKTIPCT